MRNLGVKQLKFFQKVTGSFDWSGNPITLPISKHLIMKPVLCISKVQNIYSEQNMDKSMDSQFPMECIQNVGEKNYGTTTLHYNTRWKRRAKNFPC